MGQLKDLFDSYAAERLTDATPEEVERYREIFMAGVVVAHAMYGDPTRTFAQQRRKMKELHREIEDYRLEAIVREMRQGRGA